jgi:hypothetical protein
MKEEHWWGVRFIYLGQIMKMRDFYTFEIHQAKNLFLCGVNVNRVAPGLIDSKAPL